MSLLTDEEADVLRRLLRALEGVVPEFVIAGGQAARLLRLHPLAVPLEWSPLLTTDTDVATVDKGHRGKDLAEAFEAEGFSASFEGHDEPPRTHYHRGTAEVELIVPDVARRHSMGATVEVLGASAQKVKDLEPLLVEPVELEVPDVGRVPNPAAYIIQKVLTLTNRRSLQKKGKDALYVHDALLLFTHGGHIHPEVVALAARVFSTLGRKASAKAKVLDTAAKLGDARTDFVAESARQSEGRAGLHTTEAIALANRLGLRELLGQ